MAGNFAPLAFDQSLYQALPNPLASAYRKAFNSHAPKELHDNACLFGLGLMRFAAFLGLAVVRELQPVLNADETGLLEKLDRPSEGDWLAWVNRSARRIREAKGRASALAIALDAFWQLRLDASRSEVPAALEMLLSHLEKKVVVRRNADVPDFFLALVRYRNDTIGHGAGLPDQKNQAHGEAILRAASQLAALLPASGQWELKYLVGTSLGETNVQCQLIGLTGPQWLREPPISYPRGYPTPPPQHVVLLSKPTNETLDLHPMVVFHSDRALVFNGLRGKAPAYLEYDSGQKQTIEALAADYQSWKRSFALNLPLKSASEAEGSATTPFVPSPSDVPKQRFRFDRILGRGGMGEVWLAYDNTLNRHVAVKRVRHSLLGFEEIERRFLQEARDAARLNHPNIVPILSIESDAEGTFLVLEYMDGGSLRRKLQGGPLPLPLALSHLRQLLQALDHAHHQGLVHRDLKPENILLSKAGVPKLADFGLAWLLAQAEGAEETDELEARESLEATDSGADQPPDESHAPPRVGKIGEGTRAYLAPEVRSGAAAPSPLSDLFAIGITFYEMLTARRPESICDKLIPSPVVPLLRKLVHADPNLRYGSARAAADDCVELERALEIAGRTREETSARIRRTAEQAYQLLIEGRPTDAQAAWERILAEEPDNAQAQCGMLLMQLAAGDMERAVTRYRALRTAQCDDPVFGRLGAFLNSIPAPAILHIAPRPLPFSYRIDDLRAGRQSKELVELASDTVNLGDAGELLIELCHHRPGAKWECLQCAPEHVGIRFDFPGLRVQADFRFHIKRATWLSGPRLLDADLTLTIDAEPIETYRLTRYLANRLVDRFKRPPTDWVRAESAARFGYDIAQARQQWERLTTKIVEHVLLNHSGSSG